MGYFFYFGSFLECSISLLSLLFSFYWSPSHLSTQGGLSVHLSITLRLSLSLSFLVYLFDFINDELPRCALVTSPAELGTLSLLLCLADPGSRTTHIYTHTQSLTEVRPLLWRTRQVVQSLLSLYFSSSLRAFVVCFAAIKQRSPSFFPSFFEAVSFFPFFNASAHHFRFVIRRMRHTRSHSSVTFENQNQSVKRTTFLTVPYFLFIIYFYLFSTLNWKVGTVLLNRALKTNKTTKNWTSDKGVILTSNKK